MNTRKARTINVFISLDKALISGYFKQHDKIHLYSRELSFRFEKYLLDSLRNCKRHDSITFRLPYSDEEEEQSAIPIMDAVRKRFEEKHIEEERRFAKFKRTNFFSLVISMGITSLLKAVIPLMMSNGLSTAAGLSKFIYVFDFVIFYHPITELLFNWNPFLKRMSLYKRVILAEVNAYQVKGGIPVTRSYSDVVHLPSKPAMQVS